MNRFTGLLLAGLLVLPGISMAAGELSYTNIEADYINLSIDPFDEEGTLLEDFDDGNGWAVRGSFAITDNLFIFSGYSVVDSEASFFDEDALLFSSEQDVKRFNIGGGFNIPIFEGFQRQTDFVGRFAYSDVDFGEFNFGGTSDESLDDLNEDTSDGYFIDGLVRSQLLSWLEASAGARYTEIEDADSFGFIGNALFEVTPNLGVNLEVEAGDDVSQVFLGVRYSFNR